MKTRLELHDLLTGIAAEFSIPANRVYYQPPTTIKMGYPCIVYSRSRTKARYADNAPYTLTRLYTVTVVDKNPDSEIPDRIALLPMCEHNRTFTVDNLYHYVYDLYF